MATGPGEVRPSGQESTLRQPLTPFDLLWHLAGFFAPAIGTGLLAAAFAKLAWRRELAGIGWHRLAMPATAACAAVLAGGLLITGHDGRIATYAAMIAACAVTLWWIGFRPWRRASNEPAIRRARSARRRR